MWRNLRTLAGRTYTSSPRRDRVKAKGDDFTKVFQVVSLEAAGTRWRWSYDYISRLVTGHERIGNAVAGKESLKWQRVFEWSLLYASMFVGWLKELASFSCCGATHSSVAPYSYRKSINTKYVEFKHQ